MAGSIKLGAMAHVISKSRLRAFWEKHRDAEVELRGWFTIAKRARWQSIADVRMALSKADQVKRCLVFNICHNKYRLIVRVTHNWKRIYVRHVLTHDEYGRGHWKKDCGA